MKNGRGKYEGEFKRNLKLTNDNKMETEYGTYTGEFRNG